jgi:ribosomal protein S3AE
MSDVARDDFDFLGEQLLKKSQTRPLREEMESFLEKHESEEDLQSLRRRAKSGEKLSEIVKRDRDERF